MKKNYRKRLKDFRLTGCVRTAGLFLFGLVLSSCICGGGPPKATLQYAIDYPPPSFSGLSGLQADIGVSRFSIARAYRGHEMVYSPKPYREDAYNYARWVAGPSDMIGDHLLRDLRASGLFEAVFSYCDAEEPRYVLKGGVEKIMETDRGDSTEAALAMNVILLDRGDTGHPEQIVFQRTYRAAEPMQKRTAENFAASASKAASRMAEEIIRDVHEAIQRRLLDERTESGGTTVRPQM